MPILRQRPDPIDEEISQLEKELHRGQLQNLVEQMREDRPQQPTTSPSPFVAPDTPKGGFLSRFRRHDVSEAAPQTVQQQGTRVGFVSGVPRGGANANNQALGTGLVDRETAMTEAVGSYLTCPVVSACVDVTARTITAGGVIVKPRSSVATGSDLPSARADGTPSPQVKKLQALLDYCNPDQDIRQLMRSVATSMLIFGDSFTEVGWFMGEPFALYPLDASTMSIASDEHGIVTGYDQETTTGEKAHFEPWQIIHVPLDSPNGGMYGTSPTQKARVSITTWLYAADLVKETMRKGDPPRTWVDWPIALPDSERKKLNQQYAARNVGAKNVGNLFETKGGANVKEMSVNKIDFWNAVKIESRDEIFSEFGVPPSKAAVIEAGNLGGGTGTAQDKSFRVNTCGPIEELITEKFTFALAYQAYGITDWAIYFEEVDWRDDIIVENIRDLRLRAGAWTLNRYRGDINEPEVDGGDQAVIVNRQDMVLWSDVAAMSAAGVAAKQGAGQMGQLAGIAAGAGTDQGADTGLNADGKATIGDGTQPAPSEQSDGMAALLERTKSLRGPAEEQAALEESYRRAFQQRRRRALREMPK